jgi:glycosyltransferase involved in cell wall biosynthesis
MKVALITRSTLFTARGGDTVQVMQTARYLREMGVEATIVPANTRPDYSTYDLLHFFNITRPADILKHILHTSKPFVVSPIWIDYSIYDKYHRTGAAGLTFRLLSPPAIEYMKTVARWLKGRDNKPSFTYLRKGQEKSVQEILKKASLLLTNSQEEYDTIKKEYGSLPPACHVPLGIDEKIFMSNAHAQRENDLVLCVARIEGIKNQLNLIRALNNTRYRLLLIGEAAPNQQRYYEECRELAASNVQFIGHLSQKALVGYYQRAKVHVLPSWYESCGLATMEAAAMGCNIVATRNGFATSYLAGDAFYCDPGSWASIFTAIDNAVKAPSPVRLRERIVTHYTWRQTANRTLEAYKKVIPQA